MTVDDWNKPLVTNAGKPARVVGEPDEDGDREVEADWRDDGERIVQYVYANGTKRLYPDAHQKLRNATPAEILAHPDLWPEWQVWARDAAACREAYDDAAKIQPKDALARIIAKSGQFYAVDKDGHATWIKPPTRPEGITKIDPAEYEDGFYRTPEGTVIRIEKPQPEGVYVTREMLRSAISGAGASYTVDWLADALGIPPDKPKPAPWEEAYEAWRGDRAEHSAERPAWQAAVEWCVGKIETFRTPASAGSLLLDAIRLRIMGEPK